VKGLPQGLLLAENIAPHRYAYYAYVPASTVANTTVAASITFSMAAYSGSAGLYIGSSRLGQVAPRGDVPVSFCDSSVPAWDGSTSHVTYGTVSIARGSPCFCDPATGPPCVYYAGVGSRDYASFSIVATEGSAGTVILADGLAARGVGVAGGSTSYDFLFVPSAIAAGSAAAATVTLTQVGGEADATLFVRVSSASDDAALVVTSATASFVSRVVAGSAVVAVPSNAPIFTALCGGPTSNGTCRIRITVATPMACNFAVQARTDAGLQLFDAVPVTGDARAGTLSFFRFQHTQPMSPLVISVTTGTSPVDVFVSNNGQAGMFPPGPGTGKSGWSFIATTPTTAQPVQTITVFPTDAGACAPPCTYVIGVSPSASLSYPSSRVTFSVLMRTRDVATVQLPDGRPTTDVISTANAVNYYSILLPASSVSLVLSLSALTGAAQAFGTFDGTVPSAESAARGGWSTSIDQAGGAETTFIVSRFDTRVSQWCNNNVTSFVPRTTVQTVFVLQNVTTTAWTQLTRDTVEEVPTSLGRMNVTLPGTWGNVTTTSLVPIATQQNVTNIVPVFKITPFACMLSIGVSAAAAGTSYSLMAATRHRLLPDSLPVAIAIVPGTVQYLAYEAAAGAARTTISLTPIIGRVNVYVSTTNPFPNASTASYMVGGEGASSLTLDAGTACDPSALRCVWYLSVIVDGSSSASAQVQCSSFMLTPIRVNEAVPGRLSPATGTAYYSFNAPADATGMEVTVEPLMGGWVFGMVGQGVDAVTGISLLPTATCTAVNFTGLNLAACPAGSIFTTNAAYAVQGLSSRTRMRLSASDGAAYFTPGGRFVVALSSTLDTEFVLVIRVIRGVPDNSPLPNGLMLHDTLLTASDVYYYTVPVPVSALTGPNPMPVLLQVTLLQSDVVMFLGVGNAPAALRPTAATAVATAGFAEGYRFSLSPAFLVPMCPSSGTCSVSVGVVASATGAANVPVVYGIVASAGTADSSAVRLSLGIPQLGSVARGAYSYYYVSVASVPAGSPIYVSIVQVNDGNVDLYISCTGALPSANSYDLISRAFISPELLTVFPGTAAYRAAVASGELIIAVAGAVASSVDVVEFYVQAGMAGGVTELPDGATTQASVPAGGSAFFSLPVGAPGSDIEASVTPLSGSPLLTASVWHSAGSTTFNPALRPGRFPGSYTWRMNFEGTLLVRSSDPAACTSTCTYLFAVYCGSSITCQFEIGATSALTVPVRLTLGLPQLGYLMTGMYRYYVFDGGRAGKNFTISAQSSVGSATLVLSTTFVPGVSPNSRLPSVGDPTSYSAISQDGEPLLSLYQPDSGAVASAVLGGAVPIRAERIYVVGVFAQRGPLAFNIVARTASTDTVLSPGITSALMPLDWKQTAIFSYDSQDPVSDILVTVTLLYGSIVVSGTMAGAAPVCVVSGLRVTGTASCSGAVWLSSSVGNTAQLRISATSPCTPMGTTTVVPGSCTPGPWQPSVLALTLAATDSALFQITITTAEDPLRAYDGIPMGITQISSDRPTMLLFQTSPDNFMSDLRITMAASTQLASLDYFFGSCVDSECGAVDRMPSAVANKLTGQVQAGSRQDIVIRNSSPAYCKGAPGVDICNYYLVVAPLVNYCKVQRLVPCAARVDITFSSVGGTAPILVDFATLNTRITTMTGALRQPPAIGGPITYTTYNFFINRFGAPDSSTVDIVARLDACDSLRGYPVAALCGITPGPDRSACVNIQRPRPDDPTQYNNVLIPGAAAIDRAFLLSEPSNELFASVGLQPFPSGRMGASDAALAKYGPSTFELQIVNGPAVRMRLPYWGDAMVAAPSFTRVSSTVARVFWPPVVVTADSAPNSDNFTAVNIAYRVYYAPDSFTAFAVSSTGSNSTELGIVVSTPCGLERWASLVNAAYQPVFLPAVGGVDNTFTMLTNLQPGRNYRVAVVAVCDDDCLSANHLNMGYDRPDGALSTQRVAYGVTTVMVNVDPSSTPSAKPFVDPHALPVGDPVSNSMFAGGALVAIAFVGYALFVAFRKRPVERKLVTMSSMDEGGAGTEAVVDAGSDEAVVVTVTADSHFLSARKLERPMPMFGAGASPSASRSGTARYEAGHPAAAAQQSAAELATLQRITARVFNTPQGKGVLAEQ